MGKQSFTASILEVLCEAGIQIQQLSDYGWEDVRGCEESEEARQYWDLPLFDVYPSESLHYPGKSFSLVMCFNLERAKDRAKTIGEMVRVGTGKIVLHRPEDTEHQVLISSMMDMGYYMKMFNSQTKYYVFEEEK
jgi:hypothetical protein